MSMHEGLMLIDKPKGWTSFDVVNYIRRIVAGLEGKKPKNCKVGHTGTLDPMATGLLLVCVGKYTKKVPKFIKQDKVYEVVMRLGFTSDTGDAEGVITRIEDRRMKNGDKNEVANSNPQSPIPNPTLFDVESAVMGFVGEIMQIPPAYSAIKINGKKAYELARAGITVKIDPRKITVYTISDIKYNFPDISFTTKVSSGTYIRSLVVDIGEKLGTGAYMTELRRTEIADWNITDAIEVTKVSAERLQELLITL